MDQQIHFWHLNLPIGIAGQWRADAGLVREQPGATASGQIGVTD